MKLHFYIKKFHLCVFLKMILAVNTIRKHNGPLEFQLHIYNVSERMMKQNPQKADMAETMKMRTTG